MTQLERLQAMEWLWTAFSRNMAEIPSPAWHEKIVTSRLEEIERGAARFLTIDEVKERLRHPRR